MNLSRRCFWRRKRDTSVTNWCDSRPGDTLRGDCMGLDWAAMGGYVRWGSEHSPGEQQDRIMDIILHTVLGRSVAAWDDPQSLKCCFTWLCQWDEVCQWDWLRLKTVRWGRIYGTLSGPIVISRVLEIENISLALDREGVTTEAESWRCNAAGF